MLEYLVCVLSKSVGKVATLAVPALGLANLSDLVEPGASPPSYCQLTDKR
jgi:hypothetical protein